MWFVTHLDVPSIRQAGGRKTGEQYQSEQDRLSGIPYQSAPNRLNTLHANSISCCQPMGSIGGGEWYQIATSYDLLL
jgi:hypothetical protein